MKTTSISDEELEERAIRAHLRYCRANGFIADQPSRTMTIRRGAVVIVANSYRELGRYRVLRTNKRTTLRRVVL